MGFSVGRKKEKKNNEAQGRETVGCVLMGFCEGMKQRVVFLLLRTAETKVERFMAERENKKTK